MSMTKTERIEEMERQLAALKAEVREEERVEYPCVMVQTQGRIGLFSKESCAIIINDVGIFCEDFGHGTKRMCMDGFTPFTGTITYKNGRPV